MTNTPTTDYANQTRQERIVTTVDLLLKAREAKVSLISNPLWEIAEYIVDRELALEATGNRKHFNEPMVSEEPFSPEKDFNRVCNELVNHPHMFKIGSEEVFSYLYALVTIKSWNK